MLVKRRKAVRYGLLADGTHSVVVHSISETEDNIIIRFVNNNGHSSLFLPISVESIKTLNILAGWAGIPAGNNYTIPILIGVTCDIIIEYNQVVKLKK